MTWKLSLTAITTGGQLDPAKLVEEFNRVISAFSSEDKLTIHRLVKVPVSVQATLKGPYPIRVRFSEKWAPAAVMVAKVVNRAPGSLPLYSGVTVDWEPDRDGFRVKHISGLAINSQYDVTLLVMGDNR